MEPISKVMVNGREYTVTMFDPITAFDFFHNLAEAQASGKSIKDLAKKAIGQCSDPMARDLSDPDNFKKCFSEHPEDMLPLETAALDAVTAPFMKNPKGTIKTAKS